MEDVKIKVTKNQVIPNSLALELLRRRRVSLLGRSDSEKIEFQNYLDSKSLKVKEFTIKKVSKLTADDVKERVKGIQMLPEKERLSKMLELSKETNFVFYLDIYNYSREDLVDKLYDKALTRGEKSKIKKRLAKMPSRLRYVIAEGRYTEVKFRESRDKALARLYSDK